MSKEMPGIPVKRAVDKKRIIGKNGGTRRRSGTRACCPPKKKVLHINSISLNKIV
jgi:hypothetical protein